jgi:hypothetical protein
MDRTVHVLKFNIPHVGDRKNSHNQNRSDIQDRLQTPTNVTV